MTLDKNVGIPTLVSSLPIITGTPQVGQTLSASTGIWTNNPTSFAYQWFRNGGAIGLATSPNYVPIVADVGTSITVSVVASNPNGSSAPAMSAPTGIVLSPGAGVPVNTAPPTISGTAQVGQVLTAFAGNWSNTPTSFTYKWFGNGVAIPGATAATYIPVAADVGTTITVSVVASNSIGSSLPSTSAATAPVVVASVSSITIGWTPATTPTFGQSLGTGFLNAAGGVSSGGAVLSSVATIQSISVYCTVAPGNIILGFYDNTGAGGTPGNLKASTASFALVAGWNTIPVITQIALNPGTYWFVIAANNNTVALGNGVGTAGHTYVGGQPFSMPAVAPAFPNSATATIAIYATLSTAATVGVPVNTAVPIISGSAQVGQTLNVSSNGGWTNSPISFTYQWSSSVGGAIPGATSTTYLPVAGDVGHTLTVSVVATNSVGSSNPATSAPTSAVIAAAITIPVNTAPPTISGIAQVGQTLTVSNNGTWSNTPTSFSYQWNSSATGAIPGATTSSYIPVTADVGNTLTISVVATNASGSSVPATSAPTSAVVPVPTGIPVNSGLPAISGAAQVGQALAASNGMWTNAPTSFTYQWNTTGSAPIQVYLSTPTAVNTNDQGYQFRTLIPASRISGGTGTSVGSIRVGFTFGAGTVAGALSGYICEQGTGNPWNFDGTQVQLTFSGATTFSGINGAITIFSDYVPFTLNFAKNLIIAALYGGTTVNVGEAADAAVTLYYSNTALDPSAPAPAGLLTQAGSSEGIGEVDFRVGSGVSAQIVGATAQTYVPAAGDIGSALTVSVVAHNTSGASAAATSPATSPVTAASAPGVPVNTTIPVISGPAKVGQVETASTGLWTNSPTTFTYQWNSSGGGPGTFSIAGGKIIGPNGATFVPRGIKLSAYALPNIMTSLPGTAQLTTLFHGINIVQIYYSNPADMSWATLQTYINALVAKGIVVVLQDGIGPGQPPLSGGALTASVNLVASYATLYKNNPYLWLMTQNEPALFSGPGGATNMQGITTEQIAYYNGIRATGSKTIIAFSASGNNRFESYTGVASQYSFTNNVIWDTHFYSGTSNNSPTLQGNLDECVALASVLGVVTNTNGAIPMCILEYGDSNNGTTIDPNWQQIVQAVNTSPVVAGTAGFTWGSIGYSSGVGDQLGVSHIGDPALGLSAFGNLVESYIAAGPSPAVPPGNLAGPISGATAQTYVPVTADIGHTLTATVVAQNVTGSSAPSTSVPTPAITAGTVGLPVNTTAPSITGSLAVGVKLTVSPGVWTNSPTFTYQWQNAAPTPDVTSFNAAGTVVIGGKSYSAANALQSWSLTNPNTQTLVFQVRPGDQWSADVGRPGAPNRSELDGFAQMFGPGTEINISYNFTMTSPTARTDTGGIVIGQIHNNDGQLGGATSPVFEIDLAPLDFMSMYVAYLASSPQPTNTTFYGTSTVNGIGTSYATLYADPNPIVRNHNYAMRIQIKLTAAGDNSGFVNVWRDGVLVAHSTGQIGFGFNNYWKFGIYGTVTNATQIAQYQNMMVAAEPLVLGTGTTYIPVAADIGNAITCTVTATNGVGSAAATAGTAGAVILATVPVNTAIPVISGTPKVGQTLSSTNGTWTNTPTSYIWQWLSAGANATGAGASGTAASVGSYTVVSADLGNQMTVSVIAVNAQGDSAAAVSLPTNAVFVSSTPRTANLLGIFGISGHIPAYPTAQQNAAVADAVYLGIGLWRDGISSNTAATNTVYQGFVNNGISIIGLPWLPTDQTFAGNVAGAKQVLAMGPTAQGTRALYAVEGPNEPSISTFTYPGGLNSGTTWQGVATWQHSWYQAVHADATLNSAGVLVATPSLIGAEPNNWGLQYLTVPAGPPAGVLSAAGTTFADIYNYHLYPMYTGHCQTISPGIDSIAGQLGADFVSTYLHGFAGVPLATAQASGRIITEFGYNLGTPTAGGIVTDVPTQGKNMLSGLMNAWVEGLAAFCIYTFYPFGDGNEIFNGPGSPKTSAVYIHNFTTPLVDTAATAKTFATGSVTYSISGLPSTGKSLLFQKSNLTYELIVWNNVENWNNGAGAPITIGGTSVTVTFSSSMTTTHTYDCTVSASPIATGSGTTVTFTLKDYPMVIEGIP